MRLNPFEPGSINVRRGGGGGFPGGGGGQLGCGAIVIALIGALVFGIDPGQMLGTMEGMQQGTSTQQQAPGGETAQEICDDNQYATEACNALYSLDQTWAPLFQQAGIEFRQPTLAFLATGTTESTGCGMASSAMGPFYCPADGKVYLDLEFFDQLARRFGAPGDFAQAYVIAHEVGHHVQNLIGVLPEFNQARQAMSQEQANAASVKVELQADCFAGAWAKAEFERGFLESGDLDEAMNAANQIGDDRLTGGRIPSSQFTHGTSEQRMRWFRQGYETGDPSQCDTSNP